jgi:hypothetical protein
MHEILELTQWISCQSDSVARDKIETTLIVGELREQIEYKGNNSTKKIKGVLLLQRKHKRDRRNFQGE